MNLEELYSFLKENTKLDFFVSDESLIDSFLNVANNDYSYSRIQTLNKLSYSFIYKNKMISFYELDESSILKNINLAFKLLSRRKVDYDNGVLPFSIKPSYSNIDTSFIYRFINDFSLYVLNYKEIKSYSISYNYNNKFTKSLYRNNDEFSFCNNSSAYIDVCIYIENHLDSRIIKRRVSHNYFIDLDISSFLDDMYQEGVLKLKEVDIKDGVYHLLFKNDSASSLVDAINRSSITIDPSTMPSKAFNDIFNNYSDFLIVTYVDLFDHTLCYLDDYSIKCLVHGFVVKNGVIIGFNQFCISFNKLDILSNVIRISDVPYLNFTLSPYILIKDICVSSISNLDLYPI